MTSDDKQTWTPAERDGRVIMIDVLRGLAILWVMTFHLWQDMSIWKDPTGPIGGTSRLYEAVRDRLAEGHPLAALTAAGEVVLGTGFFGVSVFMMLSGISLTMNAYRRGDGGAVRPFLMRVWRLLVPFWWGVAITVATIAAIATLKVWLDGGTYHDAWFDVRIAGINRVQVRWDDVAWALTVVPWLFREKGITIPVGSMWFVALLLQYYLLFPVALRFLRRNGPWRLIVLGIAITLVSRFLMETLGAEWIDLGHRARTLTAFAPFRLAEFTTGMAIGYALVHERDAVGEYVKSPVDVAGILVIALLLLIAGAYVTPGIDGLLHAGELSVKLRITFADPLILLGLPMLALPLLFKAPGRFEVSALARVLVFVGVVSFPALIVNESMRYFSSFLREEDLPSVAWWVFLVVVYIPGSVLLAYPLAARWGLLPRQRQRAATTASPLSSPIDARVQSTPAASGGA
ncbi:MAG TPA: acyltransferase family protein [Dehalococcoidia bacterium]